MIVNIEHLYKYFGGEILLNDINFTIQNHEIIGLIGVNGCGKSTLLKIIAGEQDFDKDNQGQGSVNIQNNVSIGFLHQNAMIDSKASIEDEIKSPFLHIFEIQHKMEEIEKLMSKTNENDIRQKEYSQKYTSLYADFEANDGYLAQVKINRILNGMGFGGFDLKRCAASLSGGEKTRLALAKLLLSEPQLLLLDEPTNHLDFETLMWLEDYLKDYKGSVVVVSHDRYFLDKICSRICEIERGILTSYKGGYSAFTLQKQMNTQRKIKEWNAKQKEIQKLEEYIAKNKTRASTAKMAKSRQHSLEKIELGDMPAVFQKPPKISLEYDIEPTKDIVKAKGCLLKVGDKTLIQNLDLHLRRGQHVGIIGANGIGKSSLLKLLLGEIHCEKGSIVWGNNVKISYFDQEHSNLNSNLTVIQQLQEEFPNLSDLQARKILACVLIFGDDVFKPIGVLSGGEKAKVCFALMILNRGNVLVLDEPTNHLDMTAKEVLEDALAEFEGTTIIVSHDRYLLNKAADNIVEITPNGVKCYEGNFDSYRKVFLEQRQLQINMENSQKQLIRRQEYEQNQQKLYRSRKQRAEDAKRRNEIKMLEENIERCEKEISDLEAEISDPQIAKDYNVLSEKCSHLQNLKDSLDIMMEKWANM